MQATISVYNVLGKLPLGSLSYANVLKPLTDLDYISRTKNSWMQVSILKMEMEISAI